MARRRLDQNFINIFFCKRNLKTKIFSGKKNIGEILIQPKARWLADLF